MKRTEVSQPYEAYFKISDNKYGGVECLVENCGTVLKSKYKYNHKRHLQVTHKDLAKSLNLIQDDEMSPSSSSGQSVKPKKCRKIELSLTRNTYIKACIKLVTKHNVPSSFFDYEGWKDISTPIEESLSVKVNPHNIGEKVGTAAQQFRHVIASEVEDKLICLKVDGASWNGRAILGINIQYIENNETIVRTLAMLEVTKKHTGKNLRREILNVLEDFRIETTNIYSCTTDIGSNMLKPVNVQEQDTCSSHNLIDVDTNADEDQFVDFENLVEEAVDPILSSVRCAAHILQLAVCDVLEKMDIRGLLEEIRGMVKKLKNDSIKNYFLNTCSRKPFLDVNARWSSAYEMVNCVVEQRSLIEELNNDNEYLNFEEELWTFSENFVRAFEPPYIFTKKLQEEQLTIGDFYKCWLACELELEKINDAYSKEMVRAMHVRSTKLFENDAFLAAIYLDPRFNFEGTSLLSTQDRLRAQEHLGNTWKLAKQHYKTPSVTGGANLVLGTKEETDNLSELELYMRRRDLVDKISVAPVENSIGKKINEFCYGGRLPVDSSILDYWASQKILLPELYFLSQIVLATPATQVTMKRAFSGLALMLSDRRTGISNENLSDLLLVKLNSELFNVDSLSYVG